MEAHKMDQNATAAPTFKELITPLLGENAIMDPSHVMALVKLPGEVLDKLESLEKLEFRVATKSQAEIGLTELKTVLRERYGYEIDVDLAASALYHLDKVFGDYHHNVTAYYWPTAEPVVFVFGGEYGSTALVVAPKIEVSIKEGEQASPSPSSSPGGGEG
jgi:hypothetical protein